MKTCNIDCDIGDEEIYSKINRNTFEFSDKQKYVFKNVIKYIRYIFEIREKYYLDELVISLSNKAKKNENDLGLGIDLKNDEIVIYYTLNKMIQEKITIWHNNIAGYIIFYNNLYIFQPYLNTNKNINICDRINNYQKSDKIEYIDVSYDDEIKHEFKFVNIAEIIKIMNSKIKEKKGELYSEYFYQNDKNDKMIIEYCLDYLTIDQKISLLKHLTKKIIDENEQSLDDDEKSYYSLLHNFIYVLDDGRRYSIKKKKKNKRKCIGFFVCNKKETKETKDYIDIYIYNKDTGEFINDNHTINSNIMDSLKHNKVELDDLLLNNKETNYWGYSYKKNTELDNSLNDHKNNVTYFVSDNIDSVSGTILDTIAQKTKIISKVNHYNLLSDFFKIYIKNIGESSLRSLYKNLKDGEDVDFDFWRKSKLKMSQSFHRKLLLTQIGDDYSVDFSYENFITMLSDIYITEIFVQKPAGQICFIINLLLRSNKLLISYDLHLFKFDKFDNFE